VLLLESVAKGSSLPWHRQKLVLLLSSMQHFAASLEAAGYRVAYRNAPSYAEGIAAAAAAQYTWLMDSDTLGIRIVCRPEYNEMDNAYTIYVLQYPDLYLKVRRTSPFARRPAAMIEWGTTFYINAITTEIFSAMLEKFAIGMDWIRRYTETGLKPHKWGGVFRSKQMTHSSILSLNREMPEIWERWVRDRIRCYNRHKI